jgi:hypothetical protein
MDGRLYGRHCDDKKPQLTIGYSAALTGEEKPPALGKRDVSDILSTAALKSMQRISSQGRRT